MKGKLWITASVGAVLSGCVSLSPDLPVASPEIPDHWQVDRDNAEINAVTFPGWDNIVKDQALKELVSKALQNNRDLRVAMINVERIRSRYQIEAASQMPDLTLGMSGERGRVGQTSLSESWSAVGSVSYEIDLFKRAESLSEVAWQSYIAEQHHYQAAEIALVTQVVLSYLDWMASQERYALAVDTWNSREASYALSERRYQVGAISSLALAQERGLVDAASREVALYGGDVSKARNALSVLVGQDLGGLALEGGWEAPLADHIAIMRNLPSSVLLSRPDIKAAEAKLRSVTANVGAARAALFPSIRISGQAGSASTELSGLFSSGGGLWSISPSLHLPVFDGGRLKAQRDIASLDQQAALMGYEKSIQEAFREVADILVDHDSLVKQYDAQKSALASAEDVLRMSRARYDAGADDYLVVLDAERSWYAARQQVISLELALRKLRIMAYKALGSA